MKLNLSIKKDDIVVFYSKDLEEFSKEFITYYQERITDIKEKLLVKEKYKPIVALTSDEKEIDFVYGKISFAGFFNDKGCYAYINLNGNKTKDYMFKGLIHELTHHLYKFFVYGKDKERITWVDEGIAQYISKQKEELEDNKKYQLFLGENLKSIDNINLNELNHDDKSFGNNNGYNLSYIAIRYLYENNTHEDFINIIKDQDKLIKIGKTILLDIKKQYDK